MHDPLFGGAAPNTTCPSGALAAGASVTCTTRAYTLTQADVDTGRIDNTATATGTGPSGATVTDAASTLSPIPAGPGLELDKSASAINDPDGNGVELFCNSQEDPADGRKVMGSTERKNVELILS